MRRGGGQARMLRMGRDGYRSLITDLRARNGQLRAEKDYAALLNRVLLAFSKDNFQEGLYEVIEHLSLQLGLAGGWACVFSDDGTTRAYVPPGQELLEGRALTIARRCRQCPLADESSRSHAGPRVGCCPVLEDLGLDPVVLEVPLIATERPLGVLHLKVPADFVLPTRTRDLLEAVGASMSILLSRLHALDRLRSLNASLEGRIEQRTFELKVLHDFAQRASYTPSYDELSSLVLTHLEQAVPSDVAASLLVVDGVGCVNIRARRPLDAGMVERILRQLVTAFQRARTGRRLPNAGFTLRTTVVDHSHGNGRPISSLARTYEVPFVVDHGGGVEVVGGLLVGADAAEAFDEARVRFVETLAHHASSSFERLGAMLDAEHSRIERLVRHLPGGMVLLDGERKVAWANVMADQLLPLLCEGGRGAAVAAIGGVPLSDVLKGGTIEVTKDGFPSRHFAVTATRADKESGDVVLLIREVTEERLRERNAAQQERLAVIGKLAGGVAHDFNNMLSVILTYSSFLAADCLPDDPRQADLQEVLEAGRRAATLVRQLLTFSRQEVVRPRVVSVNDIVVNLEKMLRRLLGEDIRLETRLGADLQPVWVDPGKMEQVLANLAVNARDAMPAGGTLSVETAEVELRSGSLGQGVYRVVPGRYVRIRVTDTGQGMSEEVMAHVFEPFFTTKERGQGTGLGLATVYGSVKQAGGYVEVSSAQGVGTTFEIHLPATLEEAHQSGPAQARDRAPSLRGSGTVLVVEDEHAVRKGAARILVDAGYEVLQASGGAHARDILEQHGRPIDLLLTDVVMPDITGPRLAAELRKGHPRLRVLYMSGYAPDKTGDLQASLGSGAGYIDKPFRAEDLTREVRTLLDAPL